MKKLIIIAFVCISSAFVSQANYIRINNDFCVNTEIPQQTRKTGTVKWFNAQKGFGFIQPDDGTTDVIVHINDVVQSGLINLVGGQKISFEVQQNPKTKKLVAVNLKAVSN